MKKKSNSKKSFADRLFAIVLAAVLVLSLCACGETGGGNGGRENTQSEQEFKTGMVRPAWGV